MHLVIGERYRVRRTNGEIVEGILVQTKGNDDHYPTFELGTGGLLGVHRDNVLGPASDNEAYEGVPRLVAIDGADESDAFIVDMDATGKHIHYQAAPDMEA